MWLGLLAAGCYPLYGQMFRSLTARLSVKELVAQAGRSNFVSSLAALYAPDSAPE